MATARLSGREPGRGSAPQLTSEGIQVRTRDAGAALFGTANAELLDLTFEVAHPVLQSVALATRGGRVCLRVGQLVAQPRELLGVLAKLLTQGIDGTPFVCQELADPRGLSLGLGGPRLFARQVAFQAGNPAAQGDDVLGSTMGGSSALAESLDLFAQRGRVLGRAATAIERIALKQSGVTREHDGHTPLG